MGSILKRTNPSGDTVYRAQIRITRAGYPNYSESKTFSKRALAAAWLKKREAELEANPDLLFEKGRKRELMPTLFEVVERYIAESVGKFGSTKPSTLRFLASFPIGSIRLDRFRKSDFSDFALSRRQGVRGIAPVASSTVNNDLQCLRSLLKHAYFVWGLPVSWSDLDLVMEGLRRGRIISKSEVRERLASNAELQQLTTYFYRQWQDYPAQCKYPMHLIIWFAVYSCRRVGEIARLRLDDWDRPHNEWLVRDMKHPRGSQGNHHIFLVRDDVRGVVDALLHEPMRERMRRRGLPSEYLIGGSSASISAAFQDTCKVLGIEDLRFHDLRHEGTTRLAEDGLTIPQMQQVTLHSDWQMLQRYVNMGTRPRLQRLDFAEAMRVASGGKFQAA